MATYAITGKLGSGKSLISVGRIQTYLRAGKRVATNLNLELPLLLHKRSKMSYIRIPDFPTLEDFNALGVGNETRDETKNGLLVLDECGVFFNSRDWGDKTRQGLISWLLHSRKLGWDVIFIVQSVEIIDKQVRLALVEHVGICKRSDRLTIPFIGFFLKAFGLPFRPPRIHICSVKYGLDQHALVVDRWLYRGVTIQNAYDTRQIFNRDSSPAIHTVLPPMLTHGRYLPPIMTWRQVLSLFPKLLLYVVCRLLHHPLPLRHA